MADSNTKTLVIDKFNGRLTRYRDGDINSGFGNFYATWGTDTFQRSGTLSFLQSAESIKGAVITDLVMAGKLRVESGVTYLYAIGHLKRLYKIQVNKTSTNDPDFDTPVLLGTLANSQTFKFGASLDFFYGSTEKIWIGHDTGITKINFDGTGETNFTAGWTVNVPRQQAQFVGNLYFTDGPNLAEVNTSEAVVTHAKLSPGFPTNSQARDIDLTPDGRYLVTTVTRNPLGDMTLVVPNASDIASTPSTIVYWNGTDAAASSFSSFPSFSMTSYHTFSSNEYIFGYQNGGCMFGTPKQVLVVDEFTNPPLPNAVGSSGDFMGWATTVFNTTTRNTNAVLSLYGTIDAETPVGHYRQLIKASTLASGDVVRIPFYSTVSAFVNAGTSSGYTTAPYNLMGTGKSYFSTLEYDGTTTSYGFWAFKNVYDQLSDAGAGVYETQHQIFSRKVKPTQVRVYFEPTGSLLTGTSFRIDLIGIDGAVLTGGTKTVTGYTLSSPNITATDNSYNYSCSVGATPAIGLRITNGGVYTPLIHRVEIDYTNFGD